jgi:LCP family protein required for cell wall assembly
LRRVLAAIVGGLALLLVPSPISDTIPWRASVGAAALVSGRPINILVLGLDRRGAEVARADVILLIRIGPGGQPARVLSLPRDLWIEIPGRGEDRLNTAYTWGALGGGSGLDSARKTVEETFGVIVSGAAVFDFSCFEQAVDAVGGVTVEVPARIVDETYPNEGGGTTSLTFDAGRQALDGRRALQYVRTRAVDSDFGRVRRQHQVVAALLKRAQSPRTAVSLGRTIAGSCPGFATDLSRIDLATVAVSMARGGEPRMRVIDESMVAPITMPSGAQVLLPRWERIRPLVAELFGTG